MKKRYIIIAIVAVVLVGGAYRRISNRGPALTSVRLGEVTMGDISSYLSTTATVKSKNSIEYYGLQAVIEKVHVTVGSEVKKGDLLISYEGQDLTTAVKQAELQYSNSILQRDELIKQGQEVQERIDELDMQIAILSDSGADVSALKQQRNALSPVSNERLKQAENSVSLAKLSLDSARQKLSEAKDVIVAENDGVVTAISAVEGSVGSSMQPAITVQNIKDLKAVASVGRYDAGDITLGQKVNIRGDKGVYEGVISFIDPVANRSTGASGTETILGIEIDILEEAPELKIEFDVDIDILIGEAVGTMKLPAEALRANKSSNYYVYTVENNIAEERQVTVGLQSDTEVEVLEGLELGDKVILNPGSTIKDGAPVREEQEAAR